jgi:hypothetical protein
MGIKISREMEAIKQALKGFLDVILRWKFVLDTIIEGEIPICQEESRI